MASCVGFVRYILLTKEPQSKGLNALKEDLGLEILKKWS